MNIQDLLSSYQFSDHLLLWLAAAFLAGLLLGLIWGRAIGKASARGAVTTAAAPPAVEAAPTPMSDETDSAPTADEAAAAPISDVADDDHADSEKRPRGLPTPDAPGISHLVGIQDKHVNKLVGVGIESIDDLLAATHDPQVRESLADELQLEDFVVNKWVRMAEFLRIPQLSPQVAEFLVFAGVNSVDDLRQRNPESLAHKLQHLNEKEQRIAEVPSREQIKKWLEHLDTP